MREKAIKPTKAAEGEQKYKITENGQRQRCKGRATNRYEKNE